ncbi:MAG: site-2 protease family protein [Nanoarchaeota archaeon]|nr:site-2 protease family protein [Nanoarchaeota archaeon]
MTLLQGILTYKWIILFYSIVLFIIIKYKHKFEIEAKIIALYKTKIGIKLMDKISGKFPRSVKVLGYIGIVIGFAGMAYISWFLIDNMYKLIMVPGAAAGVSIVIPGVPIPGSPIFVPFWSGIISIFIIASVHEFSHGVVARRFKVAIKNTGVVFFGPLIGAFVEPDEKKLAKISKRKQLAMFAAGSWSNIILAALALLVLSFLIQPAWASAVDVNRLRVIDVTKNLPAYQSGLEKGDIIQYINGVPIANVLNFTQEIDKYLAGETLIIKTEDGSEHTVITIAHPKNASKSYLGIKVYQDFKQEVIEKYGPTLPWIWFYLSNFFFILGLLSAGIGFANLLPISIFDGGRMFRIFSEWSFKKKRGFLVAAGVSSVFVLLLLFSIVISLLKAIF